MTSQTPTSSSSYDATVVIDVGTGYLRGGYAGEETPRCEIPTILTSSEQGRDEPRCPISRGCVRDWEGVERLLTQLYSGLAVDPQSRHALLLTRHVHSPVTDAERLVQLSLEVLGASAVYLGYQPVLTLYANGCTDGVVLDCGEGVTQVVPVYQGYAIDHAIGRQDLAGYDVTKMLQTSLAKRRPASVQVNSLTARDLKETLCYVSPDCPPEAEVTNDAITSRSYTLPNGDVISVGEERFRSAEVLFQPSLIGSEGVGLPKLLFQSVSACPIDVRGQLYEKIIMAGGTTRMPGICRRILKEVTSLTPRSRVKVMAGKGRQLSAWRGGSVLSSLTAFPDMCVSRQEFQEHGASIVRKKLV